MEYNAPCTGTKFKDIAIAMGVDGVENMTQEEYRKAAVDAVKKLSADVGIPADLKEILKPEDVTSCHSPPWMMPAARAIQRIRPLRISRTCICH